MANIMFQDEHLTVFAGELYRDGTSIAHAIADVVRQRRDEQSYAEVSFWNQWSEKDEAEFQADMKRILAEDKARRVEDARTAGSTIHPSMPAESVASEITSLPCVAHHIVQQAPAGAAVGQEMGG